MTVIDSGRPPADGRGSPERRPATEPSAALTRRGRLVALVVAAFLVPWCALLGMTLPSETRAYHWSLAWVGLDGAVAVAALVTVVLLARGDARAGLPAVAGGTLLLVDSWFDVCTSAPGLDEMLAGLDAVFVELPLATAALWFAVTLTRGTR
jgi:hypothetical protein